jgi:hypothetical protein
MLTKAGVAIQQAIQDWNRYNWQWLVTAPEDSDRSPYQITVGEDMYDLPYNFKDIYDIVLKTGNTYRALRQDTKRSYDRSVPHPFNSFTVAYNLLNVGQLGKLQLQNPPDSPGTMDLLYHRTMSQPCTVTGTCSVLCDGAIDEYIGGVTGASGNLQLPYMKVASSLVSKIKPGNPVHLYATGTLPCDFVSTVGSVFQTYNGFVYISLAPRELMDLGFSSRSNVTFEVGGEYYPLDVPEDHEAGLLAKATEIFLSSVGASDQRLQYWNQMAERGIDKAIADQSDKSDLDLAFEPSHFNSFNPNRLPE